MSDFKTQPAAVATEEAEASGDTEAGSSTAARFEGSKSTSSFWSRAARLLRGVSPSSLREDLADALMMPLDVTHRVLTRKARVEKIRAIGSPAAVALAEMLEFFERFDIEKYGTDGGPLHDPTVIAYILRPELFTGRDCNVEIETASALTTGMA